MIYMHRCAKMFDVKENSKIHVYARQDADGLLYASDDGTTRALLKVKDHIATVRPMMGKKQRETEKANFNRPFSLYRRKSSGLRKKLKDDTFAIKHRHLRHTVRFKDIRVHVKNGRLHTVKRRKIDCTDCVKAKMHRQFNCSLRNADTLGILYVDTKEKIKEEAVHGHKFFVISSRPKRDLSLFGVVDRRPKSRSR